MKGRKPASIVIGTMGDIPKPPAWLLRHGKSEWKRVAPILVERKHLTDADLGTLAAYANAYHVMVETTKCIGRDGMVIDTDKGPQRHPLISAQTNAHNQVRQLGAELGLSPISRSRAAVRDDTNDDDDNPLNIS